MVQGAGKVGSSRCESLMLHNREPIRLQDLEDLLVINASSGVKFGKITGAGHRATKLSVVAGEDFSQAAADAREKVRRIKRHFGDGGVEGVEPTSEESTLWSERVPVRIENPAGTEPFYGALDN